MSSPVAPVGRPRAGTLKALSAVLAHGLAGSALTLASTFVAERAGIAVYPDVMGCESGCRVVATGWPLIFVRDYLGMSVVDTADIMEVWFAADRFAWPPFLLDVAVWSLASLTVRAGVGRWRSGRSLTSGTKGRRLTSGSGMRR